MDIKHGDAGPVSTMCRNKFKVNSEIHRPNTRQQNSLHQSSVNLKKHQRVIYYFGTEIYINLPQHTKNISSDIKKYEVQLKKCLHLYSFYSIQEYFSYKPPLRHW